METLIIWREWYNLPAVKQMTDTGTLPRYEDRLLLAEWEDGEDVARRIAERSMEDGGERFRQSGEMIVIMEPAKLAGTYEISVDYEPTFSAEKVEDDL